VANAIELVVATNADPVSPTDRSTGAKRTPAPPAVPVNPPTKRPAGWLDDELVLVGAPSTDPTCAPLVTFARGANTRAIVDEAFPGVPIAMELNSIATVKGHTRAGVGIALVSRRAIARDLAGGQLVEIPHAKTPIVRPLYLVHRGRERLPPAATELFGRLREQGRKERGRTTALSR
jgi:DNA-binding transcriptional LysR family regulator